jgi:small-conductance mechanosensitive channel
VGDYIYKILNFVILDNSVQRYIISICLLVLGILVIRLIARRIIARLKTLAAKTETTFDDFLVSLLNRIVLPLSYLLVVYVGLKILSFPQRAVKIFNYLILGVILFFIVRALISFIAYGFKVYLKRKNGDITLEKSLQGIMAVIRVVVWVGAVVFFLDNLGFKISAVIAGLGIGGVAVALAAQAILKDLFSYFCILFDHPFKVGDFVIIGDFMGTIEHIGIKTTRIRSLGGEMLVFSNSDLTDSRLRNYRLMEKRRVAFNLRVVHQTPLKDLRDIPEIIKNIILKTKDASFDRAHFFSYGDYSLVFEIVYYVLSGDYNKYMDIQQDINFAIKEEFDKRGIKLAYPTQVVYLPK